MVEPVGGGGFDGIVSTLLEILLLPVIPQFLFYARSHVSTLLEILLPWPC